MYSLLYIFCLDSVNYASCIARNAKDIVFLDVSHSMQYYIFSDRASHCRFGHFNRTFIAVHCIVTPLFEELHSIYQRLNYSDISYSYLNLSHTPIRRLLSCRKV